MDPKELEGVFPPGELCLIEITGDTEIEARSEALTFTGGGVIVSGTWEVHVVENGAVDPSPVVGVRFIPWRRVAGISAQCEVGGYASRQDLEAELEIYEVPKDQRGEVLARYDVDTAAARSKASKSAKNWRSAGRVPPAPTGSVDWPTSPRSAPGA
ncbi:hypothetical protein [Streptomyces varsoviensis]|uniref:hypothetical protein n=1 Tax=Streptomyces varsoviensis TaxID=67373 RepID=UPI0004C770AF|nr:hypothetical protein [Streptomyces varsoviensis]